MIQVRPKFENIHILLIQKKIILIINHDAAAAIINAVFAKHDIYF